MRRPPAGRAVPRPDRPRVVLPPPATRQGLSPPSCNPLSANRLVVSVPGATSSGSLDTKPAVIRHREPRRTLPRRRWSRISHSRRLRVAAAVSLLLHVVVGLLLLVTVRYEPKPELLPPPSAVTMLFDHGRRTGPTLPEPQPDTWRRRHRRPRQRRPQAHRSRFHRRRGRAAQADAATEANGLRPVPPPACRTAGRASGAGATAARAG